VRGLLEDGWWQRRRLSPPVRSGHSEEVTAGLDVGRIIGSGSEANGTNLTQLMAWAELMLRISGLDGAHQLCQGWGRGFESLRPLQKSQRNALFVGWRRIQAAEESPAR
jgi:hypothetical protein